MVRTSSCLRVSSSGWAPLGAKRFVDLVRAGFFTDIALFRRNHWIVQFGAVSTEVSRDARWRKMTRHGNIRDDPDTDCFGRCRKGRLFDGALSYAGGGPNTRAAQMFVVHHQGHQEQAVPDPQQVRVHYRYQHRRLVCQKQFLTFGDAV